MNKGDISYLILISPLFFTYLFNSLFNSIISSSDNSCKLMKLSISNNPYFNIYAIVILTA